MVKQIETNDGRAGLQFRPCQISIFFRIPVISVRNPLALVLAVAVVTSSFVIARIRYSPTAADGVRTGCDRYSWWFSDSLCSGNV
jgi:hypothetical protein